MQRFLIFILTFFPLTVVAQPLQDFVQQKTDISVLKGSLWGGIAAYTDAPDTPLFALQADTRLTPASTLKLLTTAAALETLGPQYRFETRLYATAQPDAQGTLHGDLYLRGGGDPTLGSTRVPGAETYQTVLNTWQKAVEKAGIKKITGNIYADTSLFEDPSVAPKVNWENMGNYYAAPVSALCFNDNLFEIYFSPQIQGNKPVSVARTSPEIDQLALQSFVTTDAKNKKDNAYVYGAPGQYNLKIFGTIPTSLTEFKIKGALPDPALFTVQALQKQLSQHGIPVQGKAQTITDAPDYNSLLLLHTYQSPTLKDIIVIVNKRSFNLYAEVLLRHLALAEGQRGSLQNGINALNQFLRARKIASATDTVIYDGSGLARDNLITPRALLQTLVYMSNSPYFSYYYESLATPDDRGDLLLLRRFLKPQKKVKEVRIKGGTIDSVKAGAGYTRDQNGRLIAFVMMANNLAQKDEALFRAHEDIIKKLLEQE